MIKNIGLYDRVGRLAFGVAVLALYMTGTIGGGLAIVMGAVAAILGVTSCGHIRNSVNIPLPDLSRKLSGLRRDKAVILCCASGARSASAKGMLLSNGFSQVHNGGGWRGLQRKLGQ